MITSRLIIITSWPTIMTSRPIFCYINSWNYSAVPNKRHGTLSFFSVIFPPGMVLITDGTTINKIYTTPPCNTVKCWFAQAEADLLNFTPENEYFDGVNPVIQTNGWHPNKYLLNTNKLQLCATATSIFPEGGDSFILRGLSRTHVESWLAGWPYDLITAPRKASCQCLYLWHPEMINW